MFILSQDKTRIFNTSGHIEGIGYKEENFKEGKKEEIRHMIQVFGGCAEEIAEYKCKEDCLLVLYAKLLFRQRIRSKSTQRHRKSSCMTITWKEIAKRRRTQYGKKTSEKR